MDERIAVPPWISDDEVDTLEGVEPPDHRAMTIEERDALVLSNLGIVKVLVRRIANRRNYDDLVQIGHVALIEAAGAFDRTRGTSFQTYAGMVVRCRLIDHLRSLKRTVKTIPLDSEPLSRESCTDDEPPLDELNDEHRSVIGMRLGTFAMPFRHIAATIGTSKSYARSTYLNAIGRIRELMNHE